MKRFAFTLWLVLVLAACGTNGPSEPTAAPTEVPLPVIQLDVEHMVNPTLSYEIPAGAGFVLDATGYDFGTADGPSMVQVVLDGHAFTGSWPNGETTYTVRAESLLPPAGFKPLTGFPPGKQMILAVGRMSAKGRFEPLWVATVNVK